MYSVITSPKFWDDIEKVIQAQENIILYREIGNEIDISDCLD